MDKVHARTSTKAAYIDMEEARMEKKEWTAPAVESDSAFETLAACCTASAETQSGCTTDGFGGQPLLSFCPT